MWGVKVQCESQGAMWGSGCDVIVGCYIHTEVTEGAEPQWYQWLKYHILDNTSCPQGVSIRFFHRV